MDLALIKKNADLLNSELQWLARVIDIRMKLYWSVECEFKDIYDIRPSDLAGDESYYAGIIKQYNLNFDERIIILLSLAPHIQPHLLDVFFIKNSNYDRGFTEFGGIKGQNHSGFIPTCETASFILAGNNFEKRFQLFRIFSDDHVLRKFGIINLNAANSTEPFFCSVISLSPEFLNYFTLGIPYKPDFNVNFPAKRIYTETDWDDLVLDDGIKEEVFEIKDWITHGEMLLNDWGMGKKIKPGYRALFYGPPGTGKTLTATLLGKSTGLDVYRIDLSMVVSKFIGETEKNLGSVFNQAANKNWILFFDEADALFGKRTQTSSSNDRFANQEVSYLLQRIEDFPGVVILATNLKANLDVAFSRRIQSMIHFQMPAIEQRKALWSKAFSSKSVLEEKIDLDEISKKYELAGGAIINVSRHASLQAIKRGSNVLLNKDIIDGIRREFLKDGKII